MKKISFLLLISFSTLNIAAQNVSYNLNSIPITGANNSAFGYQALFSNTTGNDNTANGYRALFSNNIGWGNTAYGYQALFSNAGVPGSAGVSNTGIGANALYSNSIGNSNTGIGPLALFSNTIGSANTAIGSNALFSNTTGQNNIALGFNANVVSGDLTNATVIGYNAIVNASNTIQLGNGNVTQVFAGTSTNAKLIAGGLQITGGTLGTGKVLTSDAFGVATWQTPAGSTSYFTDATVGTGNIINTNTGGVILGTGITSTPTGYKLYVSDGIITEKVKVAVKNSIDWADYVFDKNYPLLDIATLDKYIAINKHLPGIPSAKEIKEDGGFELGKTTVKLLEKIEELTLYVIQLKKEIDEIKLKQRSDK